MKESIQQAVQQVAETLTQNGQVVVTAESLTGGMISAVLTSVPGSSAWFKRGFVTYSNEAKHEMLGVPEGILDRYTAVSDETVTHMLLGALRHSDADVAVAVSGIAGPDGALPGKPVGTVFIGVMRRDEMADIRRYRFEGDRQSVRIQTVEKALESLLGLY